MDSIQNHQTLSEKYRKYTTLSSGNGTAVSKKGGEYLRQYLKKDSGSKNS
jgi:hypothetical protein